MGQLKQRRTGESSSSGESGAVDRTPDKGICSSNRASHQFHQRHPEQDSQKRGEFDSSYDFEVLALGRHHGEGKAS